MNMSTRLATAIALALGRGSPAVMSSALRGITEALRGVDRPRDDAPTTSGTPPVHRTR
jgi:hypothetical protein